MKTISIKEGTKNIVKLNDFALNKTEKAVVTSIEKIEEFQTKTDTFLKKGLEYSDKQQEKLFNQLEKGKKSIWKNVNKALDSFGKK